MTNQGFIEKIELPKVTVLMSTFNGEKYINEQIDSILNQIGVDLSLIIRDDGSTDNTINIVSDYIKRGVNIKLIRDGERLGACDSYLRLMHKEHNSSYIALADQDDVWDNDKLVSAIRQIEKYPDTTPVLYHSNLRVVDRNLVFMRNAHSFKQEAKHKYSYFAEALPTGCTIVYNRALEKIITVFNPKTFSMHDSWVYCIASMFGKVIYDFEPHINYRQHGKNTVGTAKNRFSLDSIKQEKRRLSSKKEPRFNNALVLWNETNSLVDLETKEKLKKICNYKKSLMASIRLLVDRDIKPSTLYRRVRFDLLIVKRSI